MENLMPLTAFTSEQLFDTDGICKVKYVIGNPRNYRYDAGKGILNLNGEKPLTQKLQQFSFTPVAFRLFTDKLFVKKSKIDEENEKDWVEFFFLNESLHVCSLMFHNFSVQNFLSHYADYLYYDNLTPCECIFTIRPDPKTNEKIGADYTIASFSSTKSKPETVEAIRVLNQVIRPIFRKDTYKDYIKHTQSQNFNLPENAESKAMKLLEEEKAQEALVREFDNIGVNRTLPKPSKKAA